MRTYRKIKYTESLPWDWFVSLWNKRMMLRVITKMAWNDHLTTNREMHISEMFNSYVVFSGRERDDINRSGKVGQMNISEALRASIWNSTAHAQTIEHKKNHEYPVK